VNQRPEGGEILLLRTYEAVIIYKTESDKYGPTKEWVSGEFKNSEIKILKEVDIGERNLAYRIKKDDKGHYIQYDLEAKPEILKKIDRDFKLKPEILKYIFFRKEK
jgi:small subunit ribosomal protein S6